MKPCGIEKLLDAIQITYFNTYYTAQEFTKNLRTYEHFDLHAVFPPRGSFWGSMTFQVKRWELNEWRSRNFLFFCCPYRSISAQVFWSLATASLNQDRAVWKACWKCRCYLDHAGSTCHYLPLPLPHLYEYYKFTIIHLCILFHSSLILCEGWYFEHFSQANWTGWEF